MRIVVTIVAAVATMSFTFWTGAVGLSVVLPDGVAWAVTQGLSLLLGGLAARAFCLGFFGPMLVAPDANQGPMLGLFITGPLGFVAGGLGGAARWWRRR
jgi:hypothetical protein